MKTKLNTTNALRWLLSGLLLLAAGTSANATVTLEWVYVGDAGNANDTTGYGGVGYDYQIMTYEVTNAQYCEFLNAKAASDPNGLYSVNMNSDPRGGITRSGISGSYTYSVKTNMGDKPVNYVSVVDTQRFTNWINNGQGAGDTETGAYTVGDLAIHSGLANVWIPTENEWYKAAYYQPVGDGGDTDSYWLYPTQSNTAPTLATSSITGVINNPGSNVANYNNGADWNSQDGNLTTVGSAGLTSDSYYGTFDQGGNAWEWNEAVKSATDRGFRGSSFANNEIDMRSTSSLALPASFEGFHVGFRLATTPEPSRALLLLGGLMGVVLRRRRIGFQPVSG